MHKNTVQFCFIEPKGPDYRKQQLLRWEVLGKPLGISPEMVIQRNDRQNLHFVAIHNKKIVGCVCFQQEERTSGRIFQMAVCDEYQGKGFGRKLLANLEKSLLDLGITHVYLYAREEVEGFYSRLGYEKEGELHNRKGINHWLMRKSLKMCKSLSMRLA